MGFAHTEPARAQNRFEASQRALSAFNARRLSPRVPDLPASTEGGSDVRAAALEVEFVESERRAIQPLLRDVPTGADAFVAWFEALAMVGPGQGDPLFAWLEDYAPLEAMRWFLRQEAPRDASFVELVALTRGKLPERAKLELAESHVDELGRVDAAMRAPALERVSAHGLALGEGVVWESLALSNLLVALATRHRYAYLSLGALGVIALTAPGRAAHVHAGLRRLGEGQARFDFEHHANLAEHASAWNRRVLSPIVAADARLARPLAEGALLRLSAGARCFARYRAELGLDREGD
jgi:hypothetical protein